MNTQTKTSSDAVCGRCDAFDSEYLRPADAAQAATFAVQHLGRPALGRALRLASLADARDRILKFAAQNSTDL